MTYTRETAPLNILVRNLLIHFFSGFTAFGIYTPLITVVSSFLFVIGIMRSSHHGLIKNPFVYVCPLLLGS